MEELTIVELQERMGAGALTARSLVEGYRERIEKLDRAGPTLNSVIELNPDALEIADELDGERARSGPRGPLHGIPVMLKDNAPRSVVAQPHGGLDTDAGLMASVEEDAPEVVEREI